MELNLVNPRRYYILVGSTREIRRVPANIARLPMLQNIASTGILNSQYENVKQASKRKASVWRDSQSKKSRPQVFSF